MSVFTHPACGKETNKVTHDILHETHKLMPHIWNNVLSPLPRVLFSDRDEAKLLADLRSQLDKQRMNMADLRRTMYDLDRDRNDFLNGQQVTSKFPVGHLLIVLKLWE